jgi:hypothetical protein
VSSAPDLRKVGGGSFDPAAEWRLHPQVALRPAPLGALPYHFATRKLPFSKNTTILQVVDTWTSIRPCVRR